MDEERPPSLPSTTERLSADEIASRDFARRADGFDEHEVRAFLRRVSEHVRKLEARTAAEGATEPAPAGDARAEAVFAQLRDAGDEEPEPPRAAPTAGAEPPSPVPSVEEALAAPPEAEDAVTSELVVAAEAGDEPAKPKIAPPDEGDRLRAGRDALIESLVPDVLRASKRLLQDEQNLLLDAARRSRGRIDANRLLPEPVHHRDAWAALLSRAVDRSYNGGRTAVGRSRRPTTAPERLVHELTASVLAPLRERLKATITSVLAEGPYEAPAELHRALASAVSARYREWRGSELETRIVDALAAAYARGTYDGAPSGTRLRWVTDAPGRCPDCDDNALEAVTKAQPFPTGQTHPPAHPACRCFVLPVGAGAE